MDVRLNIKQLEVVDCFKLPEIQVAADRAFERNGGIENK